MASKTRRQRESDLKLARQGLTLLALLLGSYVWYRTSSVVVGVVAVVLAVVFIESCLILPEIIRRHRLQACGYDQVYEMNGEEFEEYLQALFIAKGYRASLTPNGSDFGADLIVEKNGQKMAVQAKHWAKRDVGVTAVQEVRAAQDYYHVGKAMVVNVGAYTKQAIDLAKACHVELWDGPRLQREVLAIGHRLLRRASSCSKGAQIFLRRKTGSLLPSVRLGNGPAKVRVWPVLGMLTLPSVQGYSSRVTELGYPPGGESDLRGSADISSQYRKAPAVCTGLSRHRRTPTSNRLIDGQLGQEG